MAVWVQKVNRLRLAGMGLTQHVWLTDWSTWLDAVQERRDQFQTDAQEVGQTFFDAHAMIKPFAIKPICQAVGAVDLAWGAGHRWFDDMVKVGRLFRENSQARESGKAVSQAGAQKGRAKAAKKASSSSGSKVKASSGSRVKSKTRVKSSAKPAASRKAGDQKKTATTRKAPRKPAKKKVAADSKVVSEKTASDKTGGSKSSQKSHKRASSAKAAGRSASRRTAQGRAVAKRAPRKAK